jgi:P27 family predicted phage terminase small subunit
MRVLTPADVEALAALCEAEAEFWDARADVRKRGIQIDVTRYDRKTGAAFYVTEDNPSVRIASDAFKRMKTLLTEFGMTPSSRTRISVAPKVEEEDPFARYERQA